MANDFYTPSGTPGTGSPGSSSSVRSEFTSLQTAFDKMPTLTGHGNEVVIVNAGGSALSSVNNSYLLSVIGAQPLNNELTSLAALDATVGLLVKVAACNYQRRVIVGTNNEVTVTNGNGAAGNVTLSLPSGLTFTGKTVTGGTFAGINVTSAGQITTNNAVITGGTANNLAITSASALTTANATITGGAITSLTQLGTNNATITGGAITNLTQLGTNNATLTGGTISGVVLNQFTANNFISNNVRISAANIVSGTVNNVAVTNLTTALNVADGGTGCNALTANSLILGNGTNPVQLVAPGTANNVLVSDGNTWKSGNPRGPAVFNSGNLTSGTNVAINNISSDASQIVIAFNNVAFNTNSRTLAIRLGSDGTNYSATVADYYGTLFDGTTASNRTTASLIEAATQNTSSIISGSVVLTNFHGGAGKNTQYKAIARTTNGVTYMTEGAFLNTVSAINSVQFIVGGGAGVFAGSGTYEISLVR